MVGRKEYQDAMAEYWGFVEVLVFGKQVSETAEVELGCKGQIPGSVCSIDCMAFDALEHVTISAVDLSCGAEATDVLLHSCTVTVSLITGSGRNLDPWRILSKFSSVQCGFAAYSLPQSVFVNARGIALCRRGDGLERVELESEGFEGSMLLFAC